MYINLIFYFIELCILYYIFYFQGVYFILFIIYQYLSLDEDSFYGKISNDNLNNDLIKQKDKEINDLKLQLLNKENTIQLLNNQIKQKIDELNNLKNKININDDDLVNILNPGEKVISTLFISSDQKIMYSIACKNTTPFVKVEEKLYEEYPEYKETDNYFLYNGNRIRRFKTVGENNIKSGKPIILNCIN